MSSRVSFIKIIISSFKVQKGNVEEKRSTESKATAMKKKQIMK